MQRHADLLKRGQRAIFVRFKTFVKAASPEIMCGAAKLACMSQCAFLAQRVPT